MKQMWSPWRSEHLERTTRGASPEDQETLFAQLAAEDRDEENLILWRGNRVFVIMNRFPYNNGHLMIVPYRPVASYEALKPEEQEAMSATIERCISWLRHALHPDGFNVGMNLGAAAGAGLPSHLHMHVVPRWEADTNFMATIGDVKVIPEAMQKTYRKLKEAVDAVPADPSRPS